MNEGATWRSICVISSDRRARFCELAQAKAVATRARIKAQDEIDPAAHEEMKADYIDGFDADIDGMWSANTQDEFLRGLAEINQNAPIRRVEELDSPIDPWLWSILAKDEKIWLDGTFIMNGDFHFILGGIEYDASAAGAYGIDVIGSSLPSPPHSNRAASSAGRLSAEWWDELWVHLIGRIYHEGWEPATQADAVRAMHDWLSLNGHEASDSTLKPRARKLVKELKAERA